MANLFLPEHCKLVDAVPGISDTFAQVTFDYVSLKNAQMAWIVILLTQTAGHETLIQPQVATSVAPAGATSITFNTDIWSNEDTGATDTLVKQSSATFYEVAGDIATKMVVFKIDPSNVVAQGSTYDCIGCTIESSKQLNLVAGLYILQERYAQDTPPSAIVD
jgi:outer membrane protein assembly factor BamE (lipoprotein component of BamABCDE complex)